MSTPAFGPSFQQAVLVAALTTDLLDRFPPGALTTLFRGEVGQGRPVSPRCRIAQAIDEFREGSPTERPSKAAVDELVRRTAARLGDEERKALAAEWGALRQSAGDGAPPDPEWVVKETRIWWRRHLLGQVLVDTGAAIKEAFTEEAIDAAFEKLRTAEKSAAIETPGVPVVADADRRVLWWAAPEDDRVAVETGFAALDSLTEGGIRVGEVFYFLAGPKGAKTTALSSVALNAVRRRHNAVLFSYEMGQRPMLMRFDRNLARASRSELREDPSLLTRAAQGLNTAGSGELFFRAETPQRRGQVAEVARYIDRLRRDGWGITLAVLDYLNIMGAVSAAKEREKRHELAGIAREISALAREEGVAVVSAALVKREVADHRVIHKEDIAESFEVLAVADGAIAICGDKEMKAMGIRALYATALREAEDDRYAGTYRVDVARGFFGEMLDSGLPKDLPPEERRGRKPKGKPPVADAGGGS